MNLGTQGANETKTTLRIRKDPNHPGSPFDLLVQPLQHIRAFERAMMGSRELQKGERFPDRLLHPFDKSGMGLLPAINPAKKTFLGLREGMPVIEFPKLLQTGIFCRFGKVIQGIAKVMNIAALPQGFRKKFGNGLFESFMMIRDNIGHLGQSPFLETDQKVFPGGAAFPVGQLHGQQMSSAYNAPQNLDSVLR